MAGSEIVPIYATPELIGWHAGGWGDGGLGVGLDHIFIWPMDTVQ
jgi:hypothetical protein